LLNAGASGEIAYMVGGFVLLGLAIGQSSGVVNDRFPPEHRYTGAPIVVTTVRIPALYGDLNLARPADAARLTTRLNRVAHDACAQLDQLYPLIPDEECVSRAVRGANPQVRAAIAKAQKKSHKS
jgi:UrcA family protein